MIHLDRPIKPVELTAELQAKLTERFKSDNCLRVWDRSFLKKALLDMSHEKCCYCEKKLGHGAPDMHVEHFKPKNLFPGDVMNWENLFPACGDCNSAKGDHNTEIEPILNPCKDDPRDYFFLDQSFYRSIDRGSQSIANTTINVLDLNDIDKKCQVRFQVVAELIKKLDEIAAIARDNRTFLQTNTRMKNYVIRGCRDLLRKCISEAEYSAFNSTALHHDEDYEDLKQVLHQEGLWSEELEDLDKRSRTCLFRNHR